MSVIPLEEKLGIIESIQKSANKKYGDNTLLIAGQAAPDLFSMQFISSGLISIDKAIMLPGFPRGSIVELFGPENSAKTLVALNFIAEVQRQGGLAVLIDVERSFDSKWAILQGINLEQLVVIIPKTGEDACDLIMMLLNKVPVDAIVVDSVSVLLSKGETANSFNESSPPALQARLVSSLLKQVLPALYDTQNRGHTVLMFINQVRAKMGALTMWGDNTEPTGGKAIKHYAKIRIRLRPAEKFKGGQAVKGKIVKCKVSAAQDNEFDLKVVYGKGLDKVDELINLALESGFITVRGAGYHYLSDTLKDLMCQQDVPSFFHGRDALNEYMSEPSRFLTLKQVLK